MLRFDPFSDIDALTRGLLASQTGSNRAPRFMPMDLCKIDDHYVLTADLPGVDPGSVDVDVDDARSDIGVPLDGVSTVILGRDLRPVPVGAIGELYVSGPALARASASRRIAEHRLELGL